MGNSKQKKRLFWIGGGISLFVAAAWALKQRLSERPLQPALDSERDTFTTDSAGDLSYYVDKSGNGRPLVLLHSINAAASAMEMKPLFEYFQGVRPVYALELPGYGFSDRGERAYLPDLYASIIREFMSNVVQEAADVVALSLTSEFVARAACQEENLFKSLVMISPTGFNRNPVEVPTDTLYKFFSFPLIRIPIYKLLSSRPIIKYYLNKSFVGESPQELIDYAYETSHQPGAVNAPLYFLSGKMFTPTVRTRIYNDLRVRTLVIYDQDPNVQFDRLPELLSENPYWQAERLAPSLGLPHWEMTAETVNVLEDFWD